MLCGLDGMRLWRLTQLLSSRLLVNKARVEIEFLARLPNIVYATMEKCGSLIAEA